MPSGFRRLLAWSAVLFLALVTPPVREVSAHGTVFTHTATNTTGTAQGEVLVDVNFTGGSLHDGMVIDNPPGCPTPTILAFGSGVRVTWPCDCVQPGQSVTFSFHSFGGGTVQFTQWSSRGTCLPGDLDGSLMQEADTAALNSTIDKDESHRWTRTGNDYDTGGPCPCPCGCPEAYLVGDAQDTGDPLDLASGEVSLRRVDLRVPGRGLDWEFSRRYRSRISFLGRVGANWEFNDHARLLLDTVTGGFTLADGNGRSDIFTLMQGGDYLSPAGSYSRLRILQGNPLAASSGPIDIEVINRHGVRTLFQAPAAPAGAPQVVLPSTRVQDRVGNAMRFLHEDATDPIRLTRVIDTLGREYVYLYNAERRLHIVRDFSGREIVLTYDTRGDLVEVRSPIVTGTPNGNDFPSGKTERYAYSSGFADPKLNHNLLSITAPNEVAAGGPPSVQFVYDNTAGANSDRCLQQILGGTNASGVAAGGSISYQYETLIAGPRGAINKTTVTDRNTNVTEYFFDAAGHPLIVRERTRGLRPTDPASYETNHFFNGDGELTKTVYPELNELEFVFVTSSDRAQQGSRQSEIRRPGPRAADQTLRTISHTFEPIYNNMLSRTEERGFTTTWTVDYQEGDNRAHLAASTGRSVAEVDALLAASGMPLNLPDQNGDGVTTDPTNAGGKVIRIDRPRVTLLAGSPQALAEGGTTQEIVTTSIYNRFGQKVSETDPEENVTTSSFYPESDPDGDGQDLLPLDPSTGGYLRQIVRDAARTTRSLASDIGRETRQDPSFTAIKMDFFYNRVGVVTGMLDGRSVRTDYFINELDEVVETTRDAAGFAYRERTFRDFNGNILLREVENRDGNTPDAGVHPGFVETSFVFDILNDTLSMSQEISPTRTATWQHRYDSNQNRILTLQPELNQVAQRWDERDLLLSNTRGFGAAEASTSTVAYDGNKNPVLRVNGESRPSSVVMTGYDQVFRIVDAVGDVEERHYDPAGNLVLEKRFGPVGGPSPTNQLGLSNVLLSQTEQHFDELGRAYQTDRVLFVSTGVSTTRPVSLQDGALSPGDGKVTTRFGFDRLGRLRFRQEDDLDLYRADFDGASRTLRTVDGEGNEVLTAYDANGNAVRVETVEKQPEGQAPVQRFVTLARFDALNRLTASITNLGRTRRVQYDSRDNAISSSDAQGPPSSETAMTTALVILNSAGNTSRTFFDGLNRVVRTEQDLRAGGQGGNPVQTVITLRQEWDLNSRLISRTDDRTNTTTYRHDALNRRIRETFADSTFNTWVRDRNDNVLTFTDANGSVRTCSYDLIDRPVLCQVARGAGVIGTTEQSWQYDGLGRTTRATDNNEPATPADDSVVTCAYDSLSRKLEEHQILGGNDQIVSFDWQDDDLRKTLTYPNGRKVGATFDGLDRLKTMSNLSGQPKSGLLASWEYIGPGRVLSRAYQNGVLLKADYDADQRIRTWNHRKGKDVLAGFAYTQDRESNLLSEERSHAPADQRKDLWAYDSIYRLNQQKRNVHARSGAVEEERAWTLDGAGDWASLRITPKNKPATTLTQTMNALNAYTGFGGTAQAEDLDGNKKDDGRFTYKWDFLHRLRTVHCKAGGELVSTHLYDASGANSSLNGSGRRVRKIVTQDRHGCSGSRREASDTRYLFDGIQIIEEREGQKTVRQYVHGARLDEHLTMDVYKPNGKLDESFFYQEDGKGWVVALSDKKGKVQERYSYDAYGMPSFLGEDSKPIKNQSGSALGNPFLYNGGYFDSETGLYCSRHRMYSPQQGRFYSRDPIGIWEDGIGLGNGYAYCGGNAVNGWDPTGLESKPVDITKLVASVMAQDKSRGANICQLLGMLIQQLADDPLIEDYDDFQDTFAELDDAIVAATQHALAAHNMHPCPGFDVAVTANGMENLRHFSAALKWGKHATRADRLVGLGQFVLETLWSGDLDEAREKLAEMEADRKAGHATHAIEEALDKASEWYNIESETSDAAWKTIKNMPAQEWLKRFCR